MSAESIAQAVINLYENKLPKNGKPTPKEWTILCALVKTIEGVDGGAPEVISLATGTKSLGHTQLSPHLLSDSHGEALCRRAFLLYLYDQMSLSFEEVHPRERNKSIFIKRVLQNPSSGRLAFNTEFSLKPGVKFHLFLSYPPCGDASIIAKPESNEGEEDPVAKKIKLDEDSIRTGAKLLDKIGKGEDYYEKEQELGRVRVKPGKGIQTLSISCSDKLVKWNLLGLQGSLLSNLIPAPITYSSIIIGASAPFSSASIQRALFTRINSQLEGSENQMNLKVPQIEIFQSNSNVFKDFKLEHKSPASLIYWKSSTLSRGLYPTMVSINGRKQGVVKKYFGTPGARIEICRSNLGVKFWGFAAEFLNNEEDVEILKGMSYKDLKELNQGYKEKWDYIKKNLLKGWTDKPEDLQAFKLSDC